MNTLAVYGGSFDPITNGHVWMIERSARLFDKVDVAVATNPDKRYTFTLDERVKMVEAVVDRIFGNVTVSWPGSAFLVDHAKTVYATHLVRGVRSAADFEYERTMRNVNGDICRDVETVLLVPPRELCEVSSSMVKGLVGPDGWEKIVARYVPHATLEALKRWRSTRNAA